MRLKAISPFIASVLLIGFTISTGIIVYYFLTTLPRVQTQEVSTQASKVLSCAGATFDVKVRNCNLLNGLVLWLPMDEGSGTIAYDYSGYGNNGTLYSGTNVCSNPPTSGCPTWVDGKFGKAISFDGVNDWIRLPPLFPNSGVCNLAMMAWSFDIGMDPSYPRGGVVSGQSNGWANIEYNDNNLRFELRNSSNGNAIFISGDYRNKWLSTALVLDNGYVRAYINGSKVWDGTYIGCIGLTDWRIGVHDRYFNGTIDEVRIYNRALSDDEIKQLYYEGLTNKFNITIGLLNSGYADLGNSFTAIVYLKNGTIFQLPLVLDNNLSKGYYLEKTLTIDGYYPSYGLVDKIIVCSNDCQGVCSEIKINNQC